MIMGIETQAGKQKFMFEEKKMKAISRISILLILIFLTGCATNRGVVQIQSPEKTPHLKSNGKEVYIKSVSDKRVFQENPKTQDIPSLGFGGSSSAKEAIKKRAIARKRNSFGQAMGDILLEEGQTVETVIADILKQAFQETGYKVINSKETVSDDTIIVKADIQNFWAYMTPGFWALTLSSDISTDIEMIFNDTQNKKITVHSEGKYQMATEGNWMEVVDLSVQKYLSEVKKEI